MWRLRASAQHSDFMTNFSNGTAQGVDVAEVLGMGVLEVTPQFSVGVGFLVEVFALLNSLAAVGQDLLDPHS